MSMIINSFNQLTTDRQKARATEFINRSDRDVTKMALRSYNVSHRKSNQNITKGVDTAIKSLPIVALASGLLLKKGVKSSLKRSAEWGLAVGSPIIVSKIGNKLAMPDENGKKHLPFGTHLGATIAGFIGAEYLLNKASKNGKVNKIADTIIEGSKDTFNKIRPEFKFSHGLKIAISDFKSDLMNRKFISNTVNTVKNSKILNTIGSSAKNIAKKAVQHAPGLVAIGAIGALIIPAINQGVQVSSTKSKIKNAQLNTARDLVNVYAAENKELKAKNS